MTKALKLGKKYEKERKYNNMKKQYARVIYVDNDPEARREAAERMGIFYFKQFKKKKHRKNHDYKCSGKRFCKYCGKQLLKYLMMAAFGNEGNTIPNEKSYLAIYYLGKYFDYMYFINHPELNDDPEPVPKFDDWCEFCHQNTVKFYSMSAQISDLNKAKHGLGMHFTRLFSLSVPGWFVRNSNNAIKIHKLKKDPQQLWENYCHTNLVKCFAIAIYDDHIKSMFCMGMYYNVRWNRVSKYYERRLGVERDKKSKNLETHFFVKMVRCYVMAAERGHKEADSMLTKIFDENYMENDLVTDILESPKAVVFFYEV